MRVPCVRIFLSLAVSALAGCNPSPFPTPGPPPPCDPAKVCAKVFQRPAANCQEGPRRDKNQYFLRNDHPDRNLWVSYQERIDHLNQPGIPPTVTPNLRRIAPKAELELSCEYKLANPDAFDRWSYSVLTACFDNDPACQVHAIPPGPAPATCATRCTSPDCMWRKLTPRTSPIERAALLAAANEVRRVLYSSLPTRFDLNQLLGIGAACEPRSPVDVDPNGAFISTGSTCQVWLGPFNHPEITAIQMTVDATVGGVISGSTPTKNLTPTSPEQMLMNYYDANRSSLGVEGIKGIVMSHSQLRIIGARHYCMWVDLPPEDVRHKTPPAHQEKR
jgi:hypothetical protein